ncbi:LysE family translocator [Ferrimonas balearica]|uniref:LysE family translocator n=1 Tax=Ferrimonas balearica TaxID=44012 RepID=UPI001C5617E2|nr:LysE family translocator [Ferrimonas balearica]MBW3164108.1 LysE family translocator [Ferrimonas balearica]MBY6224081.1 LysE family translocator [Ferrimonas balearica]
MTLTLWLSLAAVCTLGAMSPGPSLALVIRNTVQGGAGRGVVTALGHGIGIALYALLVAMGLGLVITQTPALFEAIRYAGAAFLLYLAWQAIKPKPASSDATPGTDPYRRYQGFVGGFLVAFLNPKIAIFFLALFSQYVQEGAPWSDKLIMMATAGGIDALWYALVALGVARTPLMGWLKHNSHWLDRGTAVVLTVLAIRVVM